MLGIGKDARRLMIVATHLLQEGVRAGLSLYEIGTIMYRQDLEQPSVLADCVRDAIESAINFGDAGGPSSHNHFQSSHGAGRSARGGK